MTPTRRTAVALYPNAPIYFTLKALTTNSCQVQWQMFSRNKGFLARHTGVA